MKIDKQMLHKAETRNSNGCELMDTEAAFRRCFSKQMFLNILDVLKKRLQHRCFPVNIAQIL